MRALTVIEAFHIREQVALGLVAGGVGPVVRDTASARQFTDALEAAPRSYWGRTSISAGIDRAMQLLADLS